MGRFRVGDHLCVNLSRRSLCDNCWAEICTGDRGRRVESCGSYKPPFAVFSRCKICGALYEVFSNFGVFEPELCARCDTADRRRKAGACRDPRSTLPRSIRVVSGR